MKDLSGEVKRYLEGAKSVVEDDASFKRDNPDITIKDYALEQIVNDIEFAKQTGQTEWRKELKQIWKLVNMLA